MSQSEDDLVEALRAGIREGQGVDAIFRRPSVQAALLQAVRDVTDRVIKDEGPHTWKPLGNEDKA